ncbi:MAG: hypothetical protein WC522_05080 [Candidatus Omnitrophota bacterium]
MQDTVMAHRRKYFPTISAAVIFTCLLSSLFSSSAGGAEDKDYINNVVITNETIDIERSKTPILAYLYITVNNNGGRKIANLALEMSYYGEGGYLIKKVIVKDALNDPVPPGQARRYKVCLRDNFVNEKNEQYPYSRIGEVVEFDLKVAAVKLASK